MGFRGAVLLLLCVSLGTCATIGHYQTQSDQEEAAAAVAAAAGTEALADAAKEDAAAAHDFPAADAGFGERAEEARPEAPRRGRRSSEEQWNEIAPVEVNRSLDGPLVGGWGLDSIRSGFQSVHGYFDSLVELVGGRNGVCQYRCKYGDPPEPRSGYQTPEPNGCSSSLVGFQLDLGIPAMTHCCNQLDVCYDTCGSDKYSCDAAFRSCLHSICSNLKRSLGFVSKVQACESMADALYNTVWTLGCRPYMNGQRAACVCRGEERDEL
ncbi:group XIIB secretory phospholipase A2-like protein isoform X2 [Betta splendens]|uniref:Group XIIB secretory phospholipase A2-like protein isoform X2 n=1 Tax=Betta splendens TaxID=158456 RepID=A0A6P7PEG5_BETSP|nr:group XIIB secretory phospholipase A2-like protein isoform X2 [Betta splendens]